MKDAIETIKKKKKKKKKKFIVHRKTNNTNSDVTTSTKVLCRAARIAETKPKNTHTAAAS